MTDQPYTEAEVEAAARAIVVFSKRSSDEWRDAVVHAALTAAYGCPDGTVASRQAQLAEAKQQITWMENFSDAQLAAKLAAAEARAERYREALRDVQTVCHASSLVAPEIQQVYRIARQALEQP